MNSKSAPKKKEKIKLPLLPDYTGAFKKDWTRLERSGRYDMARLKAVMLDLIADVTPLDAARRDHVLQGNWQDYRECHIGGDFLLIYQKTDTTIVFVRTGSHADLFEN
ncbi:MAG: type II toxin-antitoxin system YafQ family toxin [Acetobacteraceae bacterium]|nr:type II toxin-antitoxin system YafQ family toxin [Acetobacteraceae bacterium]